MKWESCKVMSLCVFLLLVACNSSEVEDETTASTAVISTEVNIGDDDNDFVENQSWSSAISIVWNGPTATITGEADGVSISNDNGYVVVTSAAKGVEYQLSGTGIGQLKVYSDYKLKLSLNDLTLSCTNGPAINNQCKKSLYVVLSGTNSLSDGSTYATTDGEDQKAALFSEGQVIVSGTGELAVTGNYKHALCSDDYLRIRDGVISLTANQSDGIHTNDGVIINGGTINITAANDGIQCDTSSVVITDGKLTIAAAGDKGIVAYSNLQISGGTVVVNSEDKGIKSASGNIIISGGDITVKTTGTDGKGILAKLGAIQITDGQIRVTTEGEEAKGIKAVGDLIVSGGDITVICNGGSSQSGSGRMAPPSGNGGMGGNGGQMGGFGGNESTAPEGIESKAKIEISGGRIYSQSSDDAINSASDMTISGGYVCAYSTGNDGLDANGNLYIKGGVVYAIGSSSPEVAIDANTEGGYKLYVTGGTIVAIGGLESGSSLSQTCYSTNSWSSSAWYALYNGDNLALAFKTPASGGSGLVVSTASTPKLSSGVTTANGTQIFNGMAVVGATVSGGSSVSLSSYSSGNSFGRR